MSGPVCARPKVKGAPLLLLALLTACLSRQLHEAEVWTTSPAAFMDDASTPTRVLDPTQRLTFTSEPTGEPGQPMPTPEPTSTVEPTATPRSTHTATPTHTPTASATPTPKPEVVVLAEAVNLRAGPGLTCAVVRVAMRGDRLPLLGRDGQGSWYHVVSGGEAVWIYGGDLSTANRQLAEIPEARVRPCPTATPIPTPTPTPTPTDTPRPATPPMVAGQIPTLEQMSNCVTDVPFVENADGIPRYAAELGGAHGILISKSDNLKVTIRRLYFREGEKVEMSLDGDIARIYFRQVVDRQGYPSRADSFTQVDVNDIYSIDQVHSRLAVGTQLDVIPYGGQLWITVFCEAVR